MCSILSRNVRTYGSPEETWWFSRKAKINRFYEIYNSYSRISIFPLDLHNSFPRIRNSLHPSVRVAISSLIYTIRSSNCNSSPRLTQLVPSNCNSYSFLRYTLRKLREQNTNPRERIPSHRERIAQFFLKSTFHFRAAVLTDLVLFHF